MLVDPNGELDPLVAVTGPDGFIDLAFTDAPGEPASLSFLAGTAGNYRVLVTSADGTTGGYELVYEVGR